MTTRFNINRGYITQSQRGGGGFIKLVRISDFDNSYIYKIIENNLKDEISYRDACFILEDLVAKNFLTKAEAKIVAYAVSPKALASPIKLEGTTRANILKNILINLLKEEK